MIASNAGALRACWWDGAAIRYVDQRVLPNAFVIATATDIESVVTTIATGGVCGLHSVDIFGAFGVALISATGDSDAAVKHAVDRIRDAAGTLNPCVAIDRVAQAPRDAALHEAQLAADEQRRVDGGIAKNAFALLPQVGNVLTHGNTGALATAGSGTALGAIISASHAGKRLHVFVSEGQPTRAGARMTVFELRRAGVPVTLFTDSATAWIVRSENIAAIIVGAARLAANGDVIGEIGTYGLALAAAHHGIPMYVAVRRAALDTSLERGDVAPILHTAPTDERRIASVPTAFTDVHVANLTLDVTPGHLIAGIVTEYGVIRPPYHEAIPVLMSRPTFALIDRSRS